MGDMNPPSPKEPARKKAKADPQARKWVFTVFLKPSGTPETFRLVADALAQAGAKSYCFQLEQCPDTGRLHWQGCVEWASAKRFSTLKREWGWPADAELEPVHLEVCRNWKNSVKYCSKNETRASEHTSAGPHVLNIPPGMLTVDMSKLDPLHGKELRPWQQQLFDTLSLPPNDRTVYWIWEGVGAVGKTSFAKHLLCTQRETIYVEGGRAADIKYGVCQCIESTGYPKVVIIDVPRCSTGYISYQAIEGIKNGLIFSSKYESKTCIFPSPHVVVFSNQRPDGSKLSADRWEVLTILPCGGLATDHVAEREGGDDAEGEDNHPDLA